MFSCEQRFTMVKNGVSGIKKCFVHRSEEYLISRATFPTYFIKDKKRTEEIQADLDIVLFGEKIAPKLGIIKRFVGTEPNCCVTSAYNRRLKKLLPKYRKIKRHKCKQGKGTYKDKKVGRKQNNGAGDDL